MKRVEFKRFSREENQTWKTLFDRQTPLREKILVPEFSQGLKALGLSADQIPDLDRVNRQLKSLTGWEGVPVEGLEDGASFYHMLSLRQFPIGNFIRDPEDLSYTPAPDIFHDLYGHIPFFANPPYAQFCQEYGRQAQRFAHDANVLREFERFFWFTVEFGLIETPAGRRIFGAGIASSFGECEYALSSKPKVFPFHVEKIRAHEFQIDVFQEELFVLSSPDQLYSSLELFVQKYAESAPDPGKF